MSASAQLRAYFVQGKFCYACLYRWQLEFPCPNFYCKMIVTKHIAHSRAGVPGDTVCSLEPILSYSVLTKLLRDPLLMWLTGASFSHARMLMSSISVPPF